MLWSRSYMSGFDTSKSGAMGCCWLHGPDSSWLGAAGTVPTGLDFLHVAVGVCSALFYCLTDFTAWSTRHTKWFAPTGWGICSCYVTEQLLHSAQLTLPQGRAGGNVCMVSTGCHGFSEGCEPLPTNICPVLLSSSSQFNNNCPWAVNHSKMKTHLKPLISVCKNMLNEKNLELDFTSQATIYAAEMKSEWKLSDSWPSEEGQSMCWFLFGPENCVSCVRLGEGGGEAPQVKQLFEDEIIVWLYHCVAVWPTEA